MNDAQIRILPDELLKHIMGFLPIENILSVSKVCREFYVITHEITYFKTNILKQRDTDIKEYRDYLKFMPKCYNGIKQFKYMNVWKNIPIKINYSMIYTGMFICFDNLISNYITKCCNIFELTLELYFDESIFKKIEANLPHTVKKLNLINIFGEHEHMVISMFDSRKIPNVKSLQLRSINLKENSNFEHIETLLLSDIYITQISENMKFQLSNIKNLNISNSRIQFNDIDFLNKTEEFSYLSNNRDINQDKIISISNNKKLKKCVLNILNYIDTSYFNLSILGNTNIEYLTINNFGKYILNLNGLERIKYLNLSGVRISNIHNVMFNKVLNLSNCNIKQHMIPKLLNVEKLDLSKNIKIKNTSIFSSEECNIKVLDLSYNEHIKDIDNLYNLDELSVIGCNDFIDCINNLRFLKNTRLYIKTCYCVKCIKLYKYNTQLRLLTEYISPSKCIYKYKHDWFKF